MSINFSYGNQFLVLGYKASINTIKLTNCKVGVGQRRNIKCHFTEEKIKLMKQKYTVILQIKQRTLLHINATK